MSILFCVWRHEFPQISASGEKMYHDAYTLQVVEDKHLRTLNFVAGMVPFLLNLVLDVGTTFSVYEYTFISLREMKEKFWTQKRLTKWLKLSKKRKISWLLKELPPKNAKNLFEICE